MKTHDLKTWPGPFAALMAGTKNYEIRVNDRGYAVGDTLRLREFVPGHGPGDFGYTNREVWAHVTYLTNGGEFGLPADLCVMSIKPFRRHKARHRDEEVRSA